MGFLHSLVALFVCFASFCFGALPITGAKTGGVQPRLEIRQLHQNANQWNIYLLALQRFQATDQSSMTSWYAIGGIHGTPYVPWDGVQREGPLTGYCTHSSNVFPTWHRPYIALFEQQLSYHAHQAAATFTGAARQAMTTAANNLRTPFYDWAIKPAPGQPALPTEITAKTVSVTTPQGRKTINNPLFRYAWHPRTPDIFAQPWSGYGVTLRYPTSSAPSASSNEQKAIATIANQIAGQRASLYQWFTNCKKYNEISNDAVQSASPGCHISLESLHNNFHVWIGGSQAPQGHMTIIPYSGFEPSFMMHHTQIDRLFAMWQKLYPSSYISPQAQSQGTFAFPKGTVLGPTSPLKPFHRTASGEFWTSAAVRDTKVFNYVYTDFLQGGSTQAGMRQRVNKLYGPNPSIHANARRSVPRLQRKRDSLGSIITPLLAPNNTRYEYIANIATSRFGLNGTYVVYMFLGGPSSDDTSTFGTDPNLAGSYGVFSQPGMVDSPIVTTSAVSLTLPLADKVANGLISELSEAIVVPFLTEALTWRVVDPEGNIVDPSEVPDFKVSVLGSTTTVPEDPTEFPVWSEFIPLPEITDGKPGGLLNDIGSAVGGAIGGLLGGDSDGDSDN